MKKIDKKIKIGFVAGALTACLLSTTIMPVMASTITNAKIAIGGIKIYVDDKIKKPVDANGKVIEPIIFDGTTYLPLKTAVDILNPGKNIVWDRKTKSIYIGKHNVGTTNIPMDKLKPYEGKKGFRIGKHAQLEIAGETISPFNETYYYDQTYKLDSKYSTINGKFIIPYSILKGHRAGKVKFYNVDRYGTETLIDSFEAKQGDAPIEFEIDVTACEFIKIDFDEAQIDEYEGNWGHIYDVTISTNNDIN